MEKRIVMPLAVTEKLLIMDACVRIDFIKAERSMFKLFKKHIGGIHLTSTMVCEIKEVENKRELEALGLNIVEPEIEDAFKAGIPAGRTSYQDRLCMFTAKRRGFTCVTMIQDFGNFVKVKRCST